MSNLKSIYVEGKMTMIFDEDVSVNVSEEVTTEITTEMSKDAFNQFLDALFAEANMSAEEQAKIMQMTVADFSALCTKMHDDEVDAAYQEQKQAKPETPVSAGIPKQHFLAYLAQQRCAHCNTAGRMKIIDGILYCDACGQNFGDIDNLPDLM